MATTAELTEYLAGFMLEQRIERIEEILRNRTRHITAVLENIYHPHNASAIIRNCECFGIQDLHVIESDYEYRPNTDVTRGSMKWIDVHTHTGGSETSLECIEKLQAQGYKIASTCLTRESVTPEELPIDNKIALVFGTEETGVSAEVLEKSDYLLKIPMYGFTQSLNVSVSAAICLRTLSERLRNSDINWKLSDQELTDLRYRWYTNSVKNADLLLEHFHTNN